MSGKRRDKKNRILKEGESQRSDGRYVYKYRDNYGIARYVYSWKLTPTDRVPSGKRDCLSLREKEKTILKNLADGLGPPLALKVIDLFERYERYNGNVADKTKENRKFIAEVLKSGDFGSMPIERVRLSDAKDWVIHLKNQGYAYQSISNYKGYLSAAFNLAIQDDYVRKNPFDFHLNTIIQNDTKPRVALSIQQQQSFLQFVREDRVYRKYYDDIVILLGTGLRISELCGLTRYDVDLERRLISVDHQVYRLPRRGLCSAPPKTGAGVRIIPMMQEVAEAMKRVFDRKPSKRSFRIDNLTGFLFTTRTGTPRSAVNYALIFQRILKKYREQDRIPLPEKVTPHVLRHTFCSRMAAAGMNPKALQYIMGHSDINMTLNYYAHMSAESAAAEMQRLFASESGILTQLPKPSCQTMDALTPVSRFQFGR